MKISSITDGDRALVVSWLRRHARPALQSQIPEPEEHLERMDEIIEKLLYQMEDGTAIKMLVETPDE